ncbi:MAG: Uma2 family endonuclease [Treponema sp.]|jgi:Uma2 family endonuclease|nr:Uma2 family endonuclease [Treponema sp.]
MGNAMVADERLEGNAYALVEPRFERIGSTEYAMSSPGYKHQSVLLAIGAQLREKLQAFGCMTIVAPFDVYPLYDKGDEYTLVQPDIFSVCDRSKLKDNRYNGAPKFIIEILSSNRSHDMITKLNLYEKAGVAEYWIIDPDEQIITALELSNGKYIYSAYSGEDEVPLASIPGCTVNFKKVFEHIA